MTSHAADDTPDDYSAASTGDSSTDEFRDGDALLDVQSQATVRSSADLVVAIPYLLGFEPSNSLVIVACRASRIVLTGRVSLLPKSMSITQALDSMDSLRAAIGRVGAESVGVVVYPHPRTTVRGWALPRADLFRTMVREWWGDGEREGVGAAVGVGVGDGVNLRVLDALCVRRRDDEVRYWSYLCTDPCCPPEGVVLRVDDGLAVRASFVVAGCAVATDRRSLAARLSQLPASDVSARAVRRELRSAIPDIDAEWRRSVAQRACVDVLSAATSTPTAILDAPSTVNLLYACAEVQIRDVMIAELVRHPHAAVCDVLVSAVRRLPRDARAPMAATLAATAYLRGDGALAWDAIDVALALDPDCSLAELVATCLRHGLPPHQMGADYLRCAPRPSQWDGEPQIIPREYVRGRVSAGEGEVG